MSSYEKKYLKYKMKYENLKKQIGGGKFKSGDKIINKFSKRTGTIAHLKETNPRGENFYIVSYDGDLYNPGKIEIDIEGNLELSALQSPSATQSDTSIKIKFKSGEKIINKFSRRTGNIAHFIETNKRGENFYRVNYDRDLQNDGTMEIEIENNIEFLGQGTFY
jgi:hypothetical protein